MVQKEDRKNDSRGVAGVVFGALAVFVALLLWELILRRVTGAGWKGLLYSAPFLLALSFLLAALSLWNRRWLRLLVGTALLLILFAYYVSQIVYYATFGSLYTVSMMGMGGDAMANFGWGLGEVLRQNLPFLLLSCLPLILAEGVLLFRFVKGTSLSGHLLLLLLAILLWFGGVGLLRLGGNTRLTPYYVYQDPYADTDSSSDTLGALPTTLLSGVRYLFGSDTVTVSASVTESTPPLLPVTGDVLQEADAEENEATPEYGWNLLPEIDFAALEERAPSEEIRTLCRYFSNVEGTQKNEYTGLLDGYNLIYICAESFTTAALQPEITPTLCEMADNGIILSNYYNSYLNTTTNGEFSFMTGLWADVSGFASHGSRSGTFNKTIENYMPYGLGNLFAPLGVESLAYHGYYGNYYNRAETHANLGYRCKFMAPDELVFSSEWPTSDKELIDQTVGDYVNLDRFNVYYMTFSGHGPYTNANTMGLRNMDEIRGTLTDWESYSYNALYYLSCNLELERAMRSLMDALEEAGQLDRTLIVLAGDHYPYYLNPQGFGDLTGIPNAGTLDKEKSTCILYFTGLEEPIHNDAYCCNVDILPTVLNLLGIDYDSRLLPGRDVFSDGVHMAQMYNRDFVTEYITWMPSEGIQEWSEAAALLTEEEKDNYLDYMIRLADNRYGLSLDIVTTDFYRFVWEEAGLLPD